jgi:hypothetical protein
MCEIARVREENMSERRPSFFEFWPEYLGAHRDPRTRAIHYTGTILGVCSFVIFLVTMDWRFLLAAPILGYGMAMPTHPIFEGNIPKTFEHPVLSFGCDFYMLFKFLTGGLGAELARLPAPPAAGAGAKA